MYGIAQNNTSKALVHVGHHTIMESSVIIKNGLPITNHFSLTISSLLHVSPKDCHQMAHDQISQCQ